jgi:DNA-binding MarR family transcriptional regulator
MSIYENAGTLFLGTRLKRLSDQFLSDLSKIYKGAGICFEPTWFPVFYLLDTTADVTISAIAKQLEITHSGASQMVTSLKKKGFVEISQVREDKRLKTVTFTARGEEKLKEIKPVWGALRESMDNLLTPKGQRSRVLGLLEELETGMARMNLVEAVQKRLLFNQFLEEIDIVSYREALHEPFMALVLNWIAENPHTMPRDVSWMNHDLQVVSKPGKPLIFMAVHQGEVVSACVGTLGAPGGDSELSLIFDIPRFSTPLVQALLDKMIGELKKRDVSLASIRIDVTHSGLLKIFQKNGFKLMDVEKTAARNHTCMCLSRDFKKGA